MLFFFPLSAVQCFDLSIFFFSVQLESESLEMHSQIQFSSVLLILTTLHSILPHAITSFCQSSSPYTREMEEISLRSKSSGKF